jgi:hypothetical protein
MFGSKKEPKRDMRKGMWESGPKSKAAVGEVRPVREAGPDIARPTFRPQAEGQTTHE